ncbi:MAG: CDP-glycerol glycerophosphotransferase family protein [Bacteroides sp.]|jgi:CDP-glycerol glycerophosphotransferase (TagB/SpsB family)|nr:CDP-glycerol glycerophosphotransferase family protein [Bacteroides sp.]
MKLLYMGKHYLFFVSVAYSYPILRPLQDEIRRRGDQVAWFIEPSCPILLRKEEEQLHTIHEVEEYDPIAVFTPGNYIYDFFPGIKVELFHGYPINKRGDKKDDHFSIRGWFDVYCTQGSTSTIPFKELEYKYGCFKVYETGWCKVDGFTKGRNRNVRREHPTILYSSTFTKGISSAPYLFETIARLSNEKSWNWIISFHPMFDDAEVIENYRRLSEACPNVTFHEGGLIDADLLNQADVLLCDTSSVIVEFMLMNKPVVTYRNMTPGNHLLNVLETNGIEDAIEQAILRPEKLMANIRAYVYTHERYFDGKSSSRVLDAVNDYLARFSGRIKPKPLNLMRKIKLRLKVRYYDWQPWASAFLSL